VVHLRNEANGAEITLVGTAHISEASVEDVRNIIRSEKPDAVLVELDRKRYNRLVAASPEQQFLEEMMRLFVGAGMGPVGRLIGVGLMGFYRMLAYRGLQPGREFKVRRQSEFKFPKNLFVQLLKVCRLHLQT
jgi:pheromone shutdown protein TraB